MTGRDLIATAILCFVISSLSRVVFREAPSLQLLTSQLEDFYLSYRDMLGAPVGPALCGWQRAFRFPEILPCSENKLIYYFLPCLSSNQTAVPATSSSFMMSLEVELVKFPLTTKR